MRKLFLSSLVLVFFALSMTLFQISCKKDAIAQSPQDTTLTKPQILTAKVWQLDELHNNIDGMYASYRRGGSNTTGVDYDNLRYTFNADGTGSYVDQFNVTHAINWQFTSSDYRCIQFSRPGVAPDEWTMVEITGNYLHATENFTVGTNTHNLHSFRLVQIP